MTNGQRALATQAPARRSHTCTACVDSVTSARAASAETSSAAIGAGARPTTRAVRWALENDEFGKGALFGTVVFAIVLGGALLLGQDIRKGERA